MTFHFSGTLLRFTDFRKEIELRAASVRESLERLYAECPSLRSILADASGRIRATHRFFLNGEMLVPLDLETPLAEADQLDVLTAVAGG